MYVTTISGSQGVVIRRGAAAVGISLVAAVLGGAMPAAAVATRDVSIIDDSLSPASYSPNPVGVLAGDSVRWTNNGSLNHTVTSVTGDSQTFTSGTMLPLTTFSQSFTVPGTHHYYCTIHNTSQSPTGMYGTVNVQGSLPTIQSAVSASSYTLASSDGVTWKDMDVSKLQVQASPSVNLAAALRANADLFTDTAGYNQDIGIFVSDNGVDNTTPLTWKESGGFAGTFSPNAAYVQALYNMTGGHTYVFKLKWKTNKNAPGVTIYSSAGNGPTFPGRSETSLAVETFPAGNTPTLVTQNTGNFDSLLSSDGTTWQPMDATLTTGTLTGTNSTELLGANADLFTDTAGYNQDIGLFVSVDGTTPTLLAWKESGGFAGTFSPNAAYVKAYYAMTTGHTYNFSVRWKTNKPAPGVTIYASAGNGPTFPGRSPTSLLAETLAAGANPYSAVATGAVNTLLSSDGTTWQLMNAGLNVTVPGSDNTYALLGANADLFTDTAGYNQDIGLFVTDNGVDNTTPLAWKESGGFAGTFSPNAAYVEASYPLASGHTYVFKLKWKTNKPAPGVTIYASAGNGPTFPGRSETGMFAQVTN
jgi:plastocyanin